MIPIIAGVLLLWLSSLLLREFLRASPSAVARGMRQGGGIIALVVAMAMLLSGRIEVAVALGLLGFWLARGARAPNWSRFGVFGQGKPGRVSRVRSAMIEMELDHATGSMTGTVLAGDFEGGRLDNLSRGQCLSLFAQCLSSDPEGARLLEAYFDRRFPGWRRAGQDQRDARGGYDFRSSPSRPGSMSEDEAYELLGLAKGASREQIARAHRTLMKKFHPDHGGSTDLAARVNEAKDVLMRRHPT